MDSVKKARIRLQHWISHNAHHLEEYEELVKELEEHGKIESAIFVKEMIELTSRSTESLKKALEVLGC